MVTFKAKLVPSKKSRRVLAGVAVSTGVILELDWRVHELLDGISADHEEREVGQRLVEFFARYGWHLEKLADTPLVRRLRQLSQFGIKTRCPVVGATVGQQIDSKFTRWLHSLDVAGANLAIGLIINASLEELAVMVFGGLLHDVGHSASGHDAEHWLQRQGLAHHEENGEASLLRSQPLREILVAAQIPVEDIVGFIHEKPRLGRVNGLGDTGGYITRDPEALGRSRNPEPLRAVLGVLRELDETGAFRVDDVTPVLDLLDVRARLHEEFYCSPANYIARFAFGLVLDYCLERGVISTDSVELGTSVELFHKIKRCVGDGLSPEWIRSAWRVTRGDANEWRRFWAMQYFVAQDERDRYWLALDQATRQRSIQGEPLDYNRKRLVVVDTRAMRLGPQILIARRPTANWTQRWFVATWRQHTC